MASRRTAQRAIAFSDGDDASWPAAGGAPSPYRPGALALAVPVAVLALVLLMVWGASGAGARNASSWPAQRLGTWQAAATGAEPPAAEEQQQWSPRGPAHADAGGSGSAAVLLREAELAAALGRAGGSDRATGSPLQHEAELAAALDQGAGPPPHAKATPPVSATEGQPAGKAAAAAPAAQAGRKQQAGAEAGAAAAVAGAESQPHEGAEPGMAELEAQPGAPQEQPKPPPGSAAGASAAAGPRPPAQEDPPAAPGPKAAQGEAPGGGAPGSCFASHPWVPGALDVFFAPALESALASAQTNEEALQAIDDIRWGDYTPGHDHVTLRYDAGRRRYSVVARVVGKPNLEHKRVCILALLEEAVEEHNEELVAALGGKEVTFVIETEDFPLVDRSRRWKLPPFAMCTSADHVDIPVPDFTYGCYPEARYEPTDWRSVGGLLAHKASMLPWGARRGRIFHRSNWGVGPRRGLMPLLASYAANGTDELALGARLDVADTGFMVSNDDKFELLDAQCENKFLIHTAGFSYSAGLKYKLACGSLVFKFDSKWVEFYEPALKDGAQVVMLPATEEGVDVQDFVEHSAPAIKAAVEAGLHASEPPAMAQEGQRFAREELSPEALRCYWHGVLLRYAQLYFLEPAGARAAADAAGAAGEAQA